MAMSNKLQYSIFGISLDSGRDYFLSPSPLSIAFFYFELFFGLLYTRMAERELAFVNPPKMPLDL